MSKKLGTYAEILGAYLEGKLPTSEMSLVNKVIASDEEMMAIIQEIENTDKKVNWSQDIHNDYPDFQAQFELPEITDD